ncbi:hypothetical protein Aglo03_24730 [Actinokineospora globicatena]|uniref:Uncharacterized protein n=1 Tax=Actinokineospora globicatena TaxID=103729 RepID=A0A9W6QN91_9PSEU|nr:hypothetical protein Aglo03_24730 [Actinokineospora globicatena]
MEADQLRQIAAGQAPPCQVHVPDLVAAVLADQDGEGGLVGDRRDQGGDRLRGGVNGDPPAWAASRAAQDDAVARWPGSYRKDRPDPGHSDNERAAPKRERAARSLR